MQSLHNLRSGKLALQPHNALDCDVHWLPLAWQNFKQTVGSMAATGLLGFHTGWHLGMQIFMSASVALLLEMISMAIQLYTEVSFVDKITLKNISSTDIDDSHRLKSIFSVPQGTVGILIMSMSSIVILLAVEHYIQEYTVVFGLDICCGTCISKSPDCSSLIEVAHHAQYLSCPISRGNP